MTQGTQGAYGIQLWTVVTPSGADLNLQTSEEADWYESRRDRYLADNQFPNISDLQDLDRLLQLEVMSYRWGFWVSQGFDYIHARVDETNLTTKMKEYCLSEDTEALTPEGWVTVHDLKPGTPILAYDTESGLTRWEIPTSVYTGVASRPMLSLESRQHSSLSTEDHRWFVEQRRRSGTVREWRSSAELNTQSVIPLAAARGDLDVAPKYSDAFVELIAWYWTEGHSTYVNDRPNQGEISQSHVVHPDHVRRIDAAFRAEFGAPAGPGERISSKHGPYWRVERKGEMSLFKFGAALAAFFEHYAPMRVVSPEFYMHLTSAQLRMHVETSLDADGHRTASGTAYLTQRSRAMADYFQMICLFDGREAFLRENKAGMWVVTVSPSRRAVRPLDAARQGKGATAEWVDYDGIIWCPSVPSGAWVARRNGKPFITGNSVETRLLKQSLGIDKATRDKVKGQSLTDYTDDLLHRAREFGYHRNDQYELAVTKFYELRSMVMTYDRCNTEERALLDLSIESIFEWIRDEVISEWDALSDAFRKQQSIWIRSM